MKKSVLIFVGIGLALALVLIGIFGTNPFLIDQTVFVETITVTNDDYENGVILLPESTNTIQLEWEVRPLDATNKDVTFTSNSSYVTVSDAGLVTLTQNGEGQYVSAEITIAAQDESGVETVVTIWPPIAGEDIVAYDFTTNTVALGTYYTVENDTLILFNGFDYTISSDGTTVALDGTPAAGSLSDGVLTTSQTGDLVITFSDGETTKNMNVQVVDYLGALGFASQGGYQQYLTATGTSSTTFTDKTGMYQIGSGSTFESALSVRNANADTINVFEKAITLEEYVEGSYVAVADASVYISETADNRAWFDFTEAAEGKQFRMTITAKYQTSLSLTMEFVVNDGVNVHNHQELLAAYENTAIGRINIHNRITVVANPDTNIYTDVEGLNGYLINEFISGSVGRSSIGADSGKTGNIYLRHATTDLEVVGNYQTLEGSNLPMIRNNTGHSELLQDGEHCAVQTAIFRFGYYGSTHDSGVGGLTMSNLRLMGNTQRSDDTMDSGAVNLLYFSSLGDSSVSNLNLSQGVIGLFLNDNHPTLTATDVKITETYNSAVFSWTGKLDISNSIMANNGGPSIIMVDADTNFNDETTNAYDPVLWIDEYTLNHIDNWVTGEEGWFLGLHVDSAVRTLKSEVNAFVNLQYGNSISQIVEDVSVMNFKILVMNDNPVYSDGYPEPQGQIYVTSTSGDITIARDYNFATSQTYTGGAYMAPVVSDDSGFAAVYNKYMAAWGTSVYMMQMEGVSANQAMQDSVQVARDALTPEELAIWDAAKASENMEVTTASGMTSQITIIAEWAPAA